MYSKEERLGILGVWSGRIMGDAGLRAVLGFGVERSLVADVPGLRASSRAGLVRVRQRPWASWMESGARVQEWLCRKGGGAWIVGEEAYPETLAACGPRVPPVLSWRGAAGALQADGLRHRAVAVVGTRRASRGGLERCARLVEELVDHDCAVISGGALGIDAMAHRTTLEAGGIGVVICGTGLDVTYPPEHEGLFDAIAERGLVLSSYPPGTPGKAGHFPRRNAVIAGMARATVVVESPQKSGALYTAKASQDYGRPVWVVAGEAFSWKSEGSHGLVKEGRARLLHDTSDVLKSMGGAELERTRGCGQKSLFQDEEDAFASCTGMDRRVLEVLSARGPMTRDALIDVVGDHSEVSRALLALELEGWVERLPGGRFRGGKL